MDTDNNREPEMTGEGYSLDNQEISYAANLKRVMEEDFPLDKIQKIWETYKVVHKGNRGFPNKYRELKRDYKNYRKYLEGKLDTNPIELKKGL